MNLMYCLRRARDFHANDVASYREEGDMTWRELYDRVHAVARFLRAQGLQRGDRIAVWMLNSHEYLELYFASVVAGLVIVPLNTRWNLDDVAFSVNDSESAAVVVDDRFAAECETLRGMCNGVKSWIYAGSGATPSGMIRWDVSDEPFNYIEPDPEDLAGLFYTSGTTGGPKGVMLTHRNVWANALHMMIAQRLRARWLHAAPMFHLADISALYILTMEGGSHAYIPSFEPVAFMQAVAKYKITETVLVPTMLSLLLNHPRFGEFDLSSLKHLLYGASPMPLALMEDARRKLGCRFRQGYGMTETSPVLTFLDDEDHRGEAIKSAGKPIIGVEVKVVDELDRELPPRQMGEVIARGANIMKGYWKRPEINAEVLRGGWMHTGDIGMFDEEGFLYILDRKKDMIKTGGENVYSPEVESMLMSHPAVLEAAVIGVPHEKWGETIRAIAVVRGGMALTEMELIQWARQRLTHFKCPTSAVFVDGLPKGGTGKVQKSTLRRQYGVA
jgi:long-chain acyl-CoA synthetase